MGPSTAHTKPASRRKGLQTLSSFSSSFFSTPSAELMLIHICVDVSPCHSPRPFLPAPSLIPQSLAGCPAPLQHQQAGGCTLTMLNPWPWGWPTAGPQGLSGLIYNLRQAQKPQPRSWWFWNGHWRHAWKSRGTQLLAGKRMVPKKRMVPPASSGGDDAQPPSFSWL